MSDIMAVPFDPLPIEKFERLVSACSQHRPWFDDLIYEQESTRREAVIAYLADAHSNGKVFEVWKDEALLGIILFNELCPFRDVRCHFLFFDSKLGDKRQLCLNMMHWAFTQLPVEVLRVTIPTYASALLKFVRRTLGFRFESEGRPFVGSNAAPLTADVAMLGSRKHRATIYKGQWHDHLMLSVTTDEFVTFCREHANGSQSQTTQPRLTTVAH